MTNLSALSIAELKVIATQLDCTLLGDKRRKQSWIDAIETAQASETLTEPEDDVKAVMISIDCERIAETAAKLFLDIFDKSVDEHWDSTDFCGESAPMTPIASTKKGSVSVAASIVCLLIFALTALCQILSVSIKYGCLLVMLFGRWNPNLDIWYQLTARTTSKRLSTASA